MSNNDRLPLIVLIHGWGYDCGVFAGLSNALKDRYRIQLINLPGYAGQDMIDDYSVESLAKITSDQVSEPASYLGWSMGGLIALKLAKTNPAVVNKLILMTSTPSFVKRAGWNTALDRSVLENFINAYNNEPKSTLEKFSYLAVEGSQNRRSWIRELKVLSGVVDPKALQQGLHILLTNDKREELKNLRIETLMIFGKADSLVPVTVEKQIASLENPALTTKIIAEAGHTPFLTHTEQVVKIIDEHIAG